MLSPSKRVVSLPSAAKACSSVHATVLLPLPDRPVNHSTHPFWWSIPSFVAVETMPSCHLMFVELPTVVVARGSFELDESVLIREVTALFWRDANALAI